MSGVNSVLYGSKTWPIKVDLEVKLVRNELGMIRWVYTDVEWVKRCMLMEIE